MRPPGLIPILVLPLLAATAPAARADEPARLEEFYPRLSGGVGFAGWMGDVAGLSPSGVAARIEGDWQARPGLFVNAAGELARVSDDDDRLVAPVAGRASHLSLGVRHSLFSFAASPTSLGGDMFVTAAAGREWLRWDRGGKLQRNTVSLGFGATVVLPRRDRDRPFAMIRYGMRLLFARAPDPGKVPYACDGPCEELTRTRPYDKTILLELSGHVGR